MVSDDAPFVNVSDGGQFENMGLYELVRRRCLKILICDAEEDSNFNFEGLGMAVRKCRIDFGVEITIPHYDLILPMAKGFSPIAYAEGTILYPNPIHPHNPIKGEILYIKSTLTGAEPVDLRNYKREHPAFPANPHSISGSPSLSLKAIAASVSSSASNRAYQTGSKPFDLPINFLFKTGISYRWNLPKRVARYSRDLRLDWPSDEAIFRGIFKCIRVRLQCFPTRASLQ